MTRDIEQDRKLLAEFIQRGEWDGELDKTLGPVLTAAEHWMAEVEHLRAELAEKAAEKMPHSFVKMTWACGHEGGAACVVCFDNACAERERLRAEAKKLQDVLTRRLVDG